MNYYLILNQDGLAYYVKKKSPEFITFPQQAVHHQEIIDHKLFEEFLNTFFSQMKKKETILFLSDELIYSYAIPLNENINIEEEQKKFIDTLPFSSEAIETIHMKTKTDIYFFAGNSDLYKVLVMVAQKHECSIKYVLPLLLFGQALTADQMAYDTLSKFAKQKELVIQGDFLRTMKLQAKHPSLGRQIFILIVCLSLLGGAVLWALNTTGILQ